MPETVTDGLDQEKTVFQEHGADSTGRAILRRKLRRGQILELLDQRPACVVAMEALGGAHQWSREIGKLGHEGRLIPPACVKPFAKRQSEVEKTTIRCIVFPPNHAAEAEAICQAALRPCLSRTVPAD